MPITAPKVSCVCVIIELQIYHPILWWLKEFLSCKDISTDHCAMYAFSLSISNLYCQTLLDSNLTGWYYYAYNCNRSISSFPHRHVLSLLHYAKLDFSFKLNLTLKKIRLNVMVSMKAESHKMWVWFSGIFRCLVVGFRFNTHTKLQRL